MNTEAYGDALDCAMRELTRVGREKALLVEVLHKVAEDLIVGKSDDLTLADYINAALAKVKESGK